MDGLSPRTIWYLEHLTPDLVQASSVRQVIYEGDTPYQHVQVLETALSAGCSCWTARHSRRSPTSGCITRRSFSPSCSRTRTPRRVMVAGGGEGATIREVLRHGTVEEVVMVDLDKAVVDLCREHLPEHHQGAFDDPRVTLLHEDALAYLEQRETPFDVIIIDVPDPLEGGPAYLLFTVEVLRTGAVAARAGRPDGRAVRPNGAHERARGVHGHCADDGARVR